MPPHLPQPAIAGFIGLCYMNYINVRTFVLTAAVGLTTGFAFNAFANTLADFLHEATLLQCEQQDWPEDKHASMVHFCEHYER